MERERSTRGKQILIKRKKKNGEKKGFCELLEILGLC